MSSVTPSEKYSLSGSEPEEMGPQVLVPAHCTGWRAQHAMGRRFGEAFIPNTVGSRFRL
jgi:metal-dependent hydrolase (beta-lactamase superfamily II)